MWETTFHKKSGLCCTRTTLGLMTSQPIVFSKWAIAVGRGPSVALTVGAATDSALTEEKQIEIQSYLTCQLM